MSFLRPLLKGKTAAITGGTTGIGRAITLEYIRQGCNVAVNHLGLPKDQHLKVSLLDEAGKIHGESQKQNGEAAGEILELAGDTTVPETSKQLIETAVSKWGQLDIFVANAGIFTPAELLEIDEQLLERTFRVNLHGAFYACQAAARQMVKQGKGGSIIGVSSVSALQGGGMQTHYTPTKAGVLSLMQSMAISLGKHQIRCNALMPGTVRSQLNEEDLNVEANRKELEAKIPLGRAGQPQDMAGPAVFLACPEMSSFVTGSGLLADGGMYSYLQ